MGRSISRVRARHFCAPTLFWRLSYLTPTLSGRSFPSFSLFWFPKLPAPIEDDLSKGILGGDRHGQLPRGEAGGARDPAA